jgi:RimJ/RimL family protein N-acetyltransferase
VAEIGYFLEPAYWRKGYATEAAHIIIDLAFELGANLVIATCDGRNAASEDVMKRCGMTARESDDSARLVYAIEIHN